MIATFERFEITLTKEQAHLGSHQGDCAGDIRYLLTLPSVQYELSKITPSDITAELAEYGAWDEEELKDHDQNRARILWLACGQIVDKLNERK